MSAPTASPVAKTKAVLSRKEAATTYGVSLFTIDHLVASRAVRAKKLGRRTLIDARSLEEWFEGLEDA